MRLFRGRVPVLHHMVANCRPPQAETGEDNRTLAQGLVLALTAVGPEQEHPHELEGARAHGRAGRGGRGVCEEGEW